MKRAIITGATGFIGSHLMNELLNNGYQVLAIIRENTTKAHMLTGYDKLQVIQCDLENLANLVINQEEPYEYFFHMAWNGVSGEIQTDYDTQISNIKTSLAAMDFAKKMGCKRFIGAGSIHELECIKELSGDNEIVFQGHAYKIAKLSTHYYCKIYASKIGMDFLWPLLTNTYGSGERSPRLINTMIRQLLDGVEPSLTQCDQLYDFIYITDAVRAYRFIAEMGISYKNYILGSGRVIPLKEYLQEARDVVNTDISLGFGKHPYKGIYLSREDLYNENLSQDTGFNTEISFKEGIKKTIDWIKSDK
jgi:nucleoside-diphosphate-sugar epimerase